MELDLYRVLSTLTTFARNNFNPLTASIFFSSFLSHRLWLLASYLAQGLIFFMTAAQKDAMFRRLASWTTRSWSDQFDYTYEAFSSKLSAALSLSHRPSPDFRPILSVIFSVPFIYYVYIATVALLPFSYYLFLTVSGETYVFAFDARIMFLTATIHQISIGLDFALSQMSVARIFNHIIIFALILVIWDMIGFLASDTNYSYRIYLFYTAYAPVVPLLIFASVVSRLKIILGLTSWSR